MSSKITSLICIFGVLLFANGCNVYEDNFTAEGQFYGIHSGVYGENGQCIDGDFNGEFPPSVTLMYFYQINDRYCRIGSFERDGDVFFLKPIGDTCKEFSSPNEIGHSFEYIEPFSISVEKIDAKKTRIMIDGEKDRIVEKCKMPN
jgi:hypothetical protein